MPEESRTDAVEKFLTEQKSMEERKQALIDELLTAEGGRDQSFRRKAREARLPCEFQG
jgi:hypothetical protein